MKKGSRIFVLALLVLFAMPLLVQLSQACVTLSSYRQEFLPGETMQIEVDVDYGASLSRDIYSSDIYLYDSDNELMTGNFFIMRITSKKYFIWFDVPSIPGDYSVKVRALCGESELEPISFRVLESKSVYYNQIKNQVDGKWSSLNLEENIIAGAALSYDEELYADSLEAFFNRPDSCINKNCSTKNASLAIIAYRDFSTRSQVKDLLESYQNSLKGNWEMEMMSDIAEDCNITIGNDTMDVDTFPGRNVFSLDFSKYLNVNQLLIMDNCQATSRKLIFSYKGFSKNYSISNNFLMSNLGCFGNNLKNTCDPESTAYALFALKLAGFNINYYDSAVSWLSDNADSIDQIAILYYLTSEENKLNQVLTSQTYNGAWQNKGTNDARITSLIYYILDSKEKTNNVLEALNKASVYLEGKLSSATLAEKSYILYFVYPSVEPYMSIWPGIVKVKSLDSFNIILQNKGSETIKCQINFLNGSRQVEVLKNSLKSVQISVPRIETPGALAVGEVLRVSYENEIPNSVARTYDIPIIIFTFNGTGNYFYNFTMNYSEINESQQQGIINNTMNGSTYNQTANLDTDLIKQKFYFNPLTLEQTFFDTDTRMLTAKLINKFSDSIMNIQINPSVQIIRVSVEPAVISELKANESRTILFYLNPIDLGLASGGKKEGTVLARGDYNGQEINATLTLTLYSNLTSFLKTCDELGGTDCTAQNLTCKDGMYNISEDLGARCCTSECVTATPTSGKNRTLAIIIVLAVIVILVAVLFIIKRKPKQDMKDFIDDLSKEKQPDYDDENFGKSGDFKKGFKNDEFAELDKDLEGIDPSSGEKK